MVFSGFEDREFNITEQRIVVGDQRQIDLDTFLHGRIGKAFSHPVTVGFVGDLFANGRQVILAVGVLYVCQQFGAFVCQMHAATQEITGSAHLGGIDISLREHTTGVC